MPTSLGTGVPKPHHDLRVPADLIATAERGLGAGGRPRKARDHHRRRHRRPGRRLRAHAPGPRAGRPGGAAPGRRPRLTLRDFAPGLYAEAGAMRIPRVHDLTLAYCDLFGLELRPFVMGNPKTLVHIDGQRMTVAEADARPEIGCPSTWPTTRRARPGRQLWNEATRSSASATSRAAQESLDRICCASTTSTRSASSCVMRGFSEGRARAVRRHELPRVEHERRGRRAAARDRRPGVRGHAGDRRRPGPAAARLLRGTSSRTSGSAPRSPPSSRTTDTRHRPLQRRGRAGSRSPATTRSAPSRSRCCATSRSSARLLPRASRRPSASSTTTRRPRSCFQVRHRFWERRTASSAARPSPTCRSGASATRRTHDPGRRARRSCWPPTPGARTRCAGARWPPKKRSSRRSRTSPRSTRRSRRSSSSARSTTGTTTRTRAAPSPCSSPSSRPGCTTRSSPPEGRDPLRRRAHLAVPRVDPGRARIRHPRRARRPRGSLISPRTARAVHQAA